MAFVIELSNLIVFMHSLTLVNVVNGGERNPPPMVYSRTMESRVSADEAWRPGESIQEVKLPRKATLYHILLSPTVSADMSAKGQVSLGLLGTLNLASLTMSCLPPGSSGVWYA